eukprot:TRINITY_DN5144_c0_g1_i2.p2 TRINITY_DN5144_c0_g1~~TRINITY_DN5144_c0_g1_i2.p2  ORF type:complete len:158 (+),score=20.08 TRINITY_DN5144_c0_g1_i2:222-695(+)
MSGRKQPLSDPRNPGARPRVRMRSTVDTVRVGSTVRWFDLVFATVFGVGSAVYMWAPHLLPFQGILFKHYRNPYEEDEQDVLQGVANEGVDIPQELVDPEINPLPPAPLPTDNEDKSERLRKLDQHREEFKQKTEMLAAERARLKKLAEEKARAQGH